MPLRAGQTFAQQVHATSTSNMPATGPSKDLPCAPAYPRRSGCSGCAVEIFGQLLGHPLEAMSRHEHFVVVLHPPRHVSSSRCVPITRISSLRALRAADISRGADQLLDDHAFALHPLVSRGRRADVIDVPCSIPNSRRKYRTVVLGRQEALGNPYSRGSLRLRARSPPGIVSLRDGHVALVTTSRWSFGK